MSSAAIKQHFVAVKTDTQEKNTANATKKVLAQNDTATDHAVVKAQNAKRVPEKGNTSTAKPNISWLTSSCPQWSLPFFAGSESLREASMKKIQTAVSFFRACNDAKTFPLKLNNLEEHCLAHACLYADCHSLRTSAMIAWVARMAVITAFTQSNESKPSNEAHKKTSIDPYVLLVRHLSNKPKSKRHFKVFYKPIYNILKFCLDVDLTSLMGGYDGWKQSAMKDATANIAKNSSMPDNEKEKIKQDLNVATYIKHHVINALKAKLKDIGALAASEMQEIDDEVSNEGGPDCDVQNDCKTDAEKVTHLDSEQQNILGTIRNEAIQILQRKSSRSIGVTYDDVMNAINIRSLRARNFMHLVIAQNKELPNFEDFNKKAVQQQ